MNKTKLGWKFYVSIIMVGFIGQLAWAIENNYINLWVYSQTQNIDAITWMTYASAVAATLTTFLIGALSDRIGKRKLFISWGYIIWGVSVAIFGLLSRDNMEKLLGVDYAILGVGLGMTLADVIMTFFGSSANDACFNAFVTDQTNESNRGKIESILAVLPLIANIAMILLGTLFGAGAVPSESHPEWSAAETASYLAKPWLYFFLICGALTTIVGVISLFLLPKDNCEKKKDGNYWASLIYGFRPKVVKENPDLYISLLSFMCFNCAINSFMPYYMVYFQAGNGGDFVGLGSGMDFMIVMGVILIVSSIIAVVAGLFMDKIGLFKLLPFGLASCAAGLLALYFSRENWALIVSGIVMMSGYLVCTAALGASIRNETPKNEVGLFQGVRMIFVVLIPMLIGPAVGSSTFVAVSSIDPSNPTLEKTPNANMFLFALMFIVISLIPIIWLMIRKKKIAKTDKLK